MQKAMKKVFLALTTALLVVVLAMGFAGCSKAGSVKKAFEKEGYTITVVDKDNAAAKALLGNVSEEQKKELDKSELILASKGLQSALVIKFASAGALKNYLTVEDSDGKKDTSAYDKAKDNGTINGDCLIITLSSSALDIFKKA